MMQKPSQLIGVGTLTCVFGRRGSGKSNFLRLLQRRWDLIGVVSVDAVTVYKGEKAPVDHLVHHPTAVKQSWKPTLLTVDEADEFLPVHGIPDPYLIDLVRRGRHKGVSVVLATQRPASLSQHAWALADNVFCFQLTAKRDLERIAELDGEIAEHVDRIRALEPGICLHWNPRNRPAIQWLRFPLDKSP